MKNLLIITLLVLFFSCGKRNIYKSPEIVKEVTVSPIDTSRKCGMLTIPSLRVAPQFLAAIPEGMTPNVTYWFNVDYEAYLFFGKDYNKTLAWGESVVRASERNFAKGNIRVSHIPIKVWTTPDPWHGDIHQQLDSFSYAMSRLKQAGTMPVCDFAFLLSREAWGGGEAYFGTQCTSARFQTGACIMSCTDLYRDGIVFLNHEQGHNVGCEHTFAPAWTVNGVPNQKLDCSDGSTTGCGANPSTYNYLGYFDVMGYWYKPDTIRGWTGPTAEVVRATIFSRASCLVYPNGIPGTVTPPPPIDTCTNFTQTKKDSCPAGQTGVITSSSTKICPDSWTPWIVTSNTCKTIPPAPADTTWKVCGTVAGGDTIRVIGKVSATGSLVFTSTGYTNRIHLYTKNGVKMYTTTLYIKDACGNQLYKYTPTTGWGGTTIARGYLTNGDIIECKAISSSPQTSTRCYKPGKTVITYKYP